jgi:hypothetical protein
MKVIHSEPAKSDPGCELRIGIASWDDGSGTSFSIKFAWPDKNGKVSRGGEFPIEALAQSFSFAVRKGYIVL